MTITASLATLIVGGLLPLVVALVTKSTASVGLKQFVSALAAAATGLIVTSTELDGTALISKPAALLAVTAFLASQAAYVGQWKPHAIDARIAPNIGIG